MVDAIAQLLELVEYQQQLLERALERDADAVALLLHDREHGPRPGLRVWTTRDALAYDMLAGQVPQFRTQKIMLRCYRNGKPLHCGYAREALWAVKRHRLPMEMYDLVTELSSAHNCYLQLVMSHLCEKPCEWDFEGATDWHVDASDRLRDALEVLDR